MNYCRLCINNVLYCVWCDKRNWPVPRTRMFWPIIFIYRNLENITHRTSIVWLTKNTYKNNSIDSSWTLDYWLIYTVNSLHMLRFHWLIWTVYILNNDQISNMYSAQIYDNNCVQRNLLNYHKRANMCYDYSIFYIKWHIYYLECGVPAQFNQHTL